MADLNRGPKIFQKDVILATCAILTLSSCLGLSVNYFRGLPLHPLKAYARAFSAERIDAASAFKQKDTALFVDPRSVRTYGKSHIPGAMNLHKDDPRTVNIQHQRTIIVYCDILCPLADETASLLNSQGFTSVFVLSDGLTAWAAAGYPVVAGPEL